MKRLTWVIAQYRKSLSELARGLLPFVEQELKKSGGWDKVELLTVLYEDPESRRKALERLKFLEPSCVHIHFESVAHDAGESPFAGDPHWIRTLKATLPKTKVLGTHHLVIRSDRSRAAGFGHKLLRMVGLASSTKRLESCWTEFDHVTLESKLQMPQFKTAGYEKLDWIPFPIFSFGNPTASEPKRGNVSVAPDDKVIVHFGFFSEEMAQDLTVRALAELPENVKLVLAGGARRTTDHPFLDHCLNLARTLNVRHRLHVTGLLDDKYLVDVFHRADLVVAPFRKTAGLLHLGKVFALGCPLVASNLDPHMEILETFPNAFNCFESQNVKALAEAIQKILKDPLERARLRSGAFRLADDCSAERVAQKYCQTVETLVSAPESLSGSRHPAIDPG